MQHFWSLDDVQLENAWVTIGSFDGVHRGHQEIVRKLTAGAQLRKAPSVVLTFYPHPSEVLKKKNNHGYLTHPEERASLLGDLGVDVVVTHPFSLELAKMSARDFVQKLKEKMGMEQLWVGYDFALGRGREGDVEALQRMGAEMSFSLHVVEAVKFGESVISSSQIRSLITNGDVNQAAQLLGRPFQMEGEVVAGDGRGHSLGFPTANLAVWEKYVLPKAGVYVSTAEVGGKTWGAVTNIGVRPTFDLQSPETTIEAHLLDYSANLYGQRLRLNFYERLRGEKRFPNVDGLIEQVNQDIERSREWLRRVG